jgi:hypothetical protein
MARTCSNPRRSSLWLELLARKQYHTTASSPNLQLGPSAVLRPFTVAPCHREKKISAHLHGISAITFPLIRDKMAAAVDAGYLATHLGVPQETITSVVNSPTADLVRAVLDAVTSKAHEYEELYSGKLQVDIELESVVRSSEARCQAFKATADKALQDVEDVRRKLQDEGMLS